MNGWWPHWIVSPPVARPGFTATLFAFAWPVLAPPPTRPEAPLRAGARAPVALSRGSKGLLLACRSSCPGDDGTVVSTWAAFPAVGYSCYRGGRTVLLLQRADRRSAFRFSRLGNEEVFTSSVATRTISTSRNEHGLIAAAALYARCSSSDGASSSCHFSGNSYSATFSAVIPC